MEPWKWQFAQVAFLFVAGIVFTLVVASTEAGWWVVIVIPGAFLPAVIMLVRVVREWRREHAPAEGAEGDAGRRS